MNSHSRSDRQSRNHTSNFLQAIAFFLLFSLSPAVQLPVTARTPVIVAQNAANTEADRLYQLGNQQSARGQYREALENYQQVLIVRRELGDRQGVADTLHHIGLVYENQGRYHTALDFYQRGLAIAKFLENRKHQSVLLEHLGIVSHRLGADDRALEFYQEAFTISRKLEDRARAGKILDYMGFIYTEREEHARALELYKEALENFQAIGDLKGAANTLDMIGLTYDRLGNSDKALEVLERALATFQNLGDRDGIGNTLDSLGTVYQNRGDESKALEFYHRALVTLKEVGDRPGEVLAFSNIASLYKKQGRPELAIAFYKQAVNINESLRKDLPVFSLKQQEFYTKTLTETYRNLADLLLQQNRVAEAHRLLDLLKVQELHHYLQTIDGNEKTAQGVDLHPQERSVLDNHATLQESAIELGKELAQLEQIPTELRTSAERERIVELQKIQADITQQFQAFVNSSEVVNLSQQLNRTTGGETLNLTELDQWRSHLDEIGENAAILHPFILEDRLELILITRYAPPLYRTVNIKQQDLQKVIAQFRRRLVTPRMRVSFIKNHGKKLYDLLIKPIENDLKQAQAETIIYAPDGRLRYIPLAALYDGNQWLIERFNINHITAMSLDSFEAEHSQEVEVLAGAFARGDYSFNIAEQEFKFSGLPFAGREVEQLANNVEKITSLVDEQFSPELVIPQMNNHKIVHFATHAAFVKGHPEESFILFGNGDRVSLHEIESWSLPNVDLIVFSACETAVGTIAGDGHEILGFGYQVQQTGAKAAIATLWQVDDLGTQVLMKAFYQVLQEKNPPKSEALRQAQLALIRGQELPEAVNLEHPYYWAPFILIGHGL